MTKSAYAAYRRLSPGRISQLISAGKLTALVGNQIDRDAADVELGGPPDGVEAPSGLFAAPASQDAPAAIVVAPALQPNPRLAAEQTLTDERTKSERIRREMLEMDAAERRGDLVNRRETEAAFFALSREVRDGMLSIAVELAPDLVGLTDVADIRVKLQGAIETKLRGLVDHMRQIAPPPASAIEAAEAAIRGAWVNGGYGVEGSAVHA